MKSSSKKWAALAGLASVALAISACAPGNTGGDKGDGGSSPSALPATGWVAADRDAIADGGTLNLPLDETPANWNLYNLDSGTVDDNTISSLFLPGFVVVKEDGSWEADKNFATSVELKSEDPQVVEVKINPDAVWSDGTPIGYQDIQGMFNALNGKVEAYAPTSTNVWSDIESVEAGENDQDVLITFANKNADWPSILGGIYPRWLTASPESFNTAWANGPFAPDGSTFVSGNAFVVSKFDATGKTITFEPNPQWWGDKPKLDTINFKATDRSTVGNAFANKEFDAIPINSSVDTLESAKARSDSEILSSKGVTYSHVTLNGTAGVFQDVEVRQAFAKSLDRKIMAQAVIEPLGVEPEVLNNLIFLNGQNGYEDDSADIAFDVDAAKKQLEDAGWVEGDKGIREKDGTKLTVRLVIPSETPNSALLSQQIQPMAAKAGFEVKIDTVPSADFFTKYITTETRDFEATIFAWQGTPYPISSTESIFNPADSGQNFPGVADERLDGLWAKANAELDPDARLDIAKEIDKIIMSEAVTIPLAARPNQYAVAKGLVNYGPSQFESVTGTNHWENVGWAK
ncbi:ABC transporter family substrate-binding protein [Microbacterium sp. NPDC087591]|uniref:ABC transporter family substrate-binding protein n=1 Tax=Microbacterium sp. NPDC087591 TaxID=3364192 RepID=UPI00380FF599